MGSCAFKRRNGIKVGHSRRRVVFKAEVLIKGPNTRFVVTTRTDDPLAVYDRYVDRGESENWIKDLKNALAADRLSDRNASSSSALRNSWVWPTRGFGTDPW